MKTTSKSTKKFKMILFIFLVSMVCVSIMDSVRRYSKNQSSSSSMNQNNIQYAGKI
ncbi:MAG: hypothetical protein SFY32_04885 [Bacteroidota bacterium]|nr:hypothetical protein [Bacteroidota bacterium]